MEPITLTRMIPLQGETFRLYTEPSSYVELLLEAVSDRGSADRYEQFTLMFRSGLNVFLPQGTYELSHPSGTIVIFIVPTEKRDDGFVYEAVFNVVKA